MHKALIVVFPDVDVSDDGDDAGAGRALDDDDDDAWGGASTLRDWIDA